MENKEGVSFFVLCSLFFVLCSLFFVLCSLFFVLCSLFFESIDSKAPRTKDQGPRTKYQVPSTKYQVPVTFLNPQPVPLDVQPFAGNPQFTGGLGNVVFIACQRLSDDLLFDCIQNLSQFQPRWELNPDASIRTA